MKASKRQAPSTACRKDPPPKPFESIYSCHSVAFLGIFHPVGSSYSHTDKSDMEFGDKIILPSKTLLELQTLKIPLPLLFKLSAPALPQLIQYCGVLEFSAPNGQMFAPYWMMQQLGIDEGGRIHIECALSVPKGLHCRLQPDQFEFLDLAAKLGPKALLETAMRRYSCLSVDGTMIIQYGELTFHLKVVEVKPGNVVHLFGDLDLEVDFKAPEMHDPRRPRSALPRDDDGTLKETIGTTVPIQATTKSTQSTTETFGRRLGDGGYVQSSATPSTPLKSPVRRQPQLSLKKAKEIALTAKETLDPLKYRGVKAFATTGYTLTTNQGGPAVEGNTLLSTATFPSSPSKSSEPTEITCSYCFAVIPSPNIELHQLRCKNNVAYHRFQCPTCHERPLVTKKLEHIHCSQCNYVGSDSDIATHKKSTHDLVACICGTRMPANDLEQHKATICSHVLIHCEICSLSFKRSKFDSHFSSCSNRTEQCEICKKYIRIITHEEHYRQCSLSHAQISTTSIIDTDANCPYCSKHFSTIELLDKHTENDCIIAKNFQREEVDSFPPILRGKLRRKTDLVKAANKSNPPTKKQHTKSTQKISKQPDGNQKTPVGELEIHKIKRQPVLSQSASIGIKSKHSQQRQRPS